MLFAIDDIHLLLRQLLDPKISAWDSSTVNLSAVLHKHSTAVIAELISYFSYCRFLQFDMSCECHLCTWRLHWVLGVFPWGVQLRAFPVVVFCHRREPICYCLYCAKVLWETRHTTLNSTMSRRWFDIHLPSVWYCYSLVISIATYRAIIL